MKIVFITSGLEPGKDGVGDYVSSLAGECGRRGHAVQLLALNDPHIACPARAEGMLRLPASVEWKERVETARDFLNAFDPDVVSLQFVPYGFHPRGIDFSLAPRLREIIGARGVHIMFHEIWIGAGKGARWKERIAGGLQRHCMRVTMKALNVRAVHTNNPAYVTLLGNQKIRATMLPLFGAIPVLENREPASQRGEELAFGLFGTLHPIWPPEPLLTTLLCSGKKIRIVHIGGIGRGGVLWEKMGRDYAGRIEFRRLGEQPPERIAQFFRDEIDFGIATTPWELIGKSATVAAMLEHGLPVIVNRDDWHIDGVATAPVSPLLIKMDGSLGEKISTTRRAEPQSRLAAVAAQFLADLEDAS